MSCAFKVDPRHKLVLVRPTGRFTESDFIEACRASYDHPDRVPTYAHVWDGRFIDELVMDADVIPRYRDFLAENGHRVTEGKIAVIATRSLTQTFASMLMQVSTQRTATHRLFNDVEAAAEWVGVPRSALTAESGFQRVES